jgi:hypothetical protein
MDPVDGDQVYAAERLLNHRTRRGKSEYLVKWKGWSAKHNTWEPVENILDERLIQEFNERQTAKPTVSKRKSVAAPAKERIVTPPKRGRSLRSKDDSASDTTSPSTSGESRRSAASTSVKKTLEDTSISKQDNIEDKKPTAKQNTPEDEFEVAQEKVKESDPKPVEEVITTESSPNATTDDSTESACEKKDNAETLKDAASDEKEEKEITKETLDEDSTATKEPPPLEIYVERCQKSEQSVEQNGSSSVVTKKEEAYIITNEEDPKCTHKIQVFTVASASTSSEKNDESSQLIAEEEKTERFEIVKSNLFETVGEPVDKSGETVVNTPSD